MIYVINLHWKFERNSYSLAFEKTKYIIRRFEYNTKFTRDAFRIWLDNAEMLCSAELR